MSNANLSALSLSALKVLAAESGVVEVLGDKRSKQTWILTIESAIFAATEYECAPDSELDAWVAENSDNDVSMADYPASSEEHFDDEETLIIDEWVAPELPSHAEQEAIAGTANMAASQKNASSIFTIVICLAIALIEAISIVAVAAWSISKWAIAGAVKHFAPAIAGILSAAAPQRQATNYARVA